MSSHNNFKLFKKISIFLCLSLILLSFSSCTSIEDMIIDKLLESNLDDSNLDDSNINNDISLTESQLEWIGVYESPVNDELIFVMASSATDFPLEIYGYDCYNDVCYPITRGNDNFEDDYTIYDTFDCPLPWDDSNTYNCSAVILKNGDTITYSRDYYVLSSSQSDNLSQDAFELQTLDFSFVKNESLDVYSLWEEYKDKDFDYN